MTSNTSSTFHPHFLIRELIARHGSAAVSTIDTRTQRFAVTVDDVPKVFFSNLDCAEESADHYIDELIARARRDLVPYVSRMADRVRIKNVVSGICYRRKEGYGREWFPYRESENESESSESENTSK